MLTLFIVVSLIIAFLVFLMFMILKKTVRIVNSQTKSYFVNKLQGYDDLITEKENKLQEIDDLIKICDKYENVYGSVGIHPSEIREKFITVEVLLQYTKNPKIKPEKERNAT